MEMVRINEMMVWVMMNFSLVMMLLAIPFILIHVIINIFTHKHTKSEIIYIWTSFFPLGLTCLYAFVMHVFFPVSTAAVMGWHDSLFQFQVGVANLGFGLVAILAICASFGFRRANVIGATCWFWGMAAGHIYQMFLHNDFSMANINSWFCMNLLIPFILIFCINKMSEKKIVVVKTAYQTTNDDTLPS